MNNTNGTVFPDRQSDGSLRTMILIDHYCICACFNTDD